MNFESWAAWMAERSRKLIDDFHAKERAERRERWKS